MVQFRKRKSDGQSFPVGTNKGISASNPSNEVGGIKIGNGTRVPNSSIDVTTFFGDEKKVTQQDIDREFNDFTQFNSPFGSGEITEAVGIFFKLGMRGKDLADVIRDVSAEGVQMKDIDVLGETYQFVFNNAKNKINSVLGFDIEDEGFSVSFNDVASGFDQEGEGQDKLRERLESASNNELEELKKDKFTKFFLNNTDVLL